MDVSISIVTFNTRGLLKKCLSSIFKHTKHINFQVIVVDNNSNDGTVEMVKKDFPMVKLISNKKNNFYSAANNQALKISRARYFLILNSDTYFTDNSVKKMVDYMDKHPEVGAAEGLEIYTSGKLVPTGSRDSTPLIDFYELSILGKKFKNKLTINQYRISYKNRRSDFEVEVACDAFIILRSEVFKKIGGYDESLKLYYTENDICRRIMQKNLKVMHLGSAKVMHHVSASANKLKWEKLDLYYKDLWQYYKISGRPISGTLLFFLLTLEKYILKIFRPNMFE